jgi:hypothetical protein
VPIILTVLRVVHIVAGAFWAGSALMLALVILPGLRKAGPGSERVLPMAQISQAMGLSSMLTTLAGLLLYVLISRLALSWIASGYGLILTLGALAGLAAWLLGLLSTGPTSKKLGALAGQIQAGGGPPSAEQTAELSRLQAKLATSSTWSTILATAALVLMAAARYL